MYIADILDVAVIGAGHAGIEAALASAKLSSKTVIFTINLDSVGNCPCNPSIGGTAKGNLVKELDALGGVMGKVADECCLQSRILNSGKGAAVRSLRMQIDRAKYKNIMKHILEKQENLFLKQAEIVSIEKIEEKDLKNKEFLCNMLENQNISKSINIKDYHFKLTTRLGTAYLAKAVIIASGTYLDSKIFVGKTNYSSGPDGLFPSSFLSDSLRKLNINLLRFKTGTPARVLKSSIDFSDLKEQLGDTKPYKFSTYNEKIKKVQNKVSCHISWTNKKTKEIILKNIDKSPVFSGDITGVGPRYCPSIEDKIVRFKDKERHLLFIEPCGEDTEEMYLQGMSSGLPEEVQMQFYRTIKGLENVVLMRPAYAIEYDCVDPIELDETLEFKSVPFLFGAGQFNGSSGYEEAAVQGLVAGVNAALKVKGKEKLVLSRTNSYIGTLIDDLVTKGVKEPYRMMTARSEYRLILRQDNVYERLSETGYNLGLVSEDVFKRVKRDLEIKYNEIKRFKNTFVSPSSFVNQFLVSRETSKISSPSSLFLLLKRPQISFLSLSSIDLFSLYFIHSFDLSLVDQIESHIKYEGYIKNHLSLIKNLKKFEKIKLSPNLNYFNISGLRSEAKEKLNIFKPPNIALASRIAGVNPVDISALLLWLSKNDSL